jgi:hypothetical protein
MNGFSQVQYEVLHFLTSDFMTIYKIAYNNLNITTDRHKTTVQPRSKKNIGKKNA